MGDRRREAQPPGYLTRFVGRQRELAALTQLLGTGAPAQGSAGPTPGHEHRWVTLCGVGGSGKTRLAVALAQLLLAAGSAEHRAEVDAVRWVSLALVSDQGSVAQAVAAAFSPGAATTIDPIASVAATIRDRPVVMVLDNCEHVRQGCRDAIEALLARCPRLVVVATSRVPLSGPGEHVFAVPPLRMPMSTSATQDEATQDEATQDEATQDEAMEDEALALFLDRAAMVVPAEALTPAVTATIGCICRRLDGLPLAIELSASWMRVLTAQDLLTEIERGLSFLASGSPALAERHRSMEAVLGSSWNRLHAQDRQVLSALSVFSGSFSRDAAQEVGGADLAALSSLTEKSLISRLPETDHTRYHIHELIRQYALANGGGNGDDLQQARLRHLRYFAGLVGEAEQAWDSAEEQLWLDRLRVEHANLDAAMRFSLEHERAEEALRLAAGLFAFWVYTAPLEVYRSVLERALSLPSAQPCPDLDRARSRALNVAGYAAAAAGDYDRALESFTAALTLASGLGDTALVAWTLRGRAFARWLGGQGEQAVEDVQGSQALCLALDDPAGLAWCTHDLGEIAFSLGDLPRAHELLSEGLRLFERHGMAFGAYRAAALLGDIACRQGDWLQALGHYQDAAARQRRSHFVARGGDIFEGLAAVALALHRPHVAAQLLGSGDGWRQTFGVVRNAMHQPAHQACVQSVRRRLSPEDWTAGYEHGRQLTPERATVEADRLSRELLSALAVSGARLTDRELEVLQALALGLTNAEIAARLVVSTRTVHAHLRSIFAKLGVVTRTAAAHQAAVLNVL